MRLKSEEMAENCTTPSGDVGGYFVHFILMLSFTCSRDDSAVIQALVRHLLQSALFASVRST